MNLINKYCNINLYAFSNYTYIQFVNISLAKMVTPMSTKGKKEIY